MRSTLEFAVPVWNNSITKVESDLIEQVQKRVFRFLLQHEYHSYENAIEIFKTNTLKERRDKISLKFTIKEMKKTESMFIKSNPKIVNRHTSKKIVKEYTCNTDRFFQSSIPYLSRMINKYHASKQ